MWFPPVNFVAVFVASIAAFAAGGLWFGPKTFFPVWWKAMGRDPDDTPGKGMNMGVVFAGTYAAQFAQALGLAVLIGIARAADGGLDYGAIDGALTGLIVAGTIAAAASLPHRLFAGHGFKVWVLEIGSDLVNLTVAGAILGAWK